MARIEWSAELEIGIGVIDGQHRRIVGYINALADIGANPDRATVARVIADLLDYTYSHFEFEEALMEEAGYDHLAIHQQTHNAFRTRVDALRERFANGDDVARSLAELLKTWLISDIMSDDTSYAPLVKQKMPRIERQRHGAWLGETLRRFFARRQVRPSRPVFVADQHRRFSAGRLALPAASRRKGSPDAALLSSRAFHTGWIDACCAAC